MFDRLLSLLSGNTSSSAGTTADPRVAVAALLVESARMDDKFDEAERLMIENILQDQFELSVADALRLIEQGEKASSNSVQLLSFTKQILDTMDVEDRIGVIEMLWDVAYADGVIKLEEEALITKVAGLIFVSPSDRNAAKRRALERRKISALPE